MTTPDELRELLCSDDAADHARARRLAAGDLELEAVLREHDDLRKAVASWKAQAVAPAALRQRLVGQIETLNAIHGAASETPPSGTDEARGNVIAWPRVTAWRAVLAVAASLLVVLLLGRGVVYEPAVVSTSGKLLVADALAAAHEAEQRHAQAIALLERAAAPILARADNAQTTPADAAILLAYRDRLAALDTAIAEVRTYLDENPGLASARTVLLAAYIDKSRVLEEVLGHAETGELG